MNTVLRKCSRNPVPKLFYCFKFAVCLAVSTICLLATVSFSGATVNVAAPFLQDGAGGRAIAMGENFAAIAEGPFGHLYNPAGLAMVSGLMLGFQHEGITDLVQHDVLAGHFRLGPGGIGALISFYGYGKLEMRDESGQLSGGSITPRDMLFNLGYGLQIAPDWQLGANLGYYKEDMGTSVFNGLVLDAGGIWTPFSDWTFAAVIKNVGSRIQEYRVPTSLRLGSAYRAFSQHLLLDAEVDIPLSKTTTEFGLGAEYRVWQWLDFRLGFKLPFAGTYAAVESLVLGIGFNISSLGIDLTLLNRAEFGTEASLTLVYNFGGPRSSVQGEMPDTQAKPEKTVVPQAADEEKQKVTSSASPLPTNNKEQAEFHFKAGQKYESHGQLIDAIIEYKAALKIMPAYPAAQKALATAKKKVRQETIKKETSTKSGQEYAKSASLQKLIRKYYNKGAAAYQKKDYTTAIKQLQLVLELTSQHRQATELLQKAKRAMNHEMAALRKQAAQAKAKGDIAREIEAYQKMLDLNPEDKKIKSKLIKAKEKVPQEVDRLYKEGVEYYARSQFRKALKSFETLLKLQPDHVKAKDAVRNIKEKLVQTGQ